MAATLPRDALVTTSRERNQAARLISGAGSRSEERSIELRDGQSIPPELASLLLKVLDAIAIGRTVTVGTLPEELTTSAAADMLGISRPTLMKLVRNGELPGRKVGTHTRVRTTDVLTFRRARLEKQRQAFDDLRNLEDELGLE